MDPQCISQGHVLEFRVMDLECIVGSHVQFLYAKHGYSQPKGDIVMVKT